MAEETKGNQTVNCTILKGPNDALYLISDETLQTHRLPDAVAAPLRAAYEVQTQGGTAPPPDPAVTSFKILGHGPVVRRASQTVPTMDSWWDMFRGPQPGKSGPK
jgi:hypothetical protein